MTICSTTLRCGTSPTGRTRATASGSSRGFIAGRSSTAITCRRNSTAIASPSGCARSSARLDHAAGEARAGIAGRLRLIVVRIGVDDEAAADDAIGTRRQRNAGELYIEARAPALVRLERG